MQGPKPRVKTAVVAFAVPWVAMILLSALGPSCQTGTAAEACLCADSGALEPVCCETPTSDAGNEGREGGDARSTSDVRDAGHDRAADAEADGISDTSHDSLPEDALADAEAGLSDAHEGGE
jgi:hypothetical protein